MWARPAVAEITPWPISWAMMSRAAENIVVLLNWAHAATGSVMQNGGSVVPPQTPTAPAGTCGSLSSCTGR